MTTRTIHLARNRVVAAADITRLFPCNLPKWDWAKEITFQIRLSSSAITGSPTAWSLTAKFQKSFADSSNYLDTTPGWVDFDAYDVTNRIVGGQGWFTGAHSPPTGPAAGTIADNTDTLPIFVERTVIRPPGLCRVLLQPSFTGGTSPTLTVANVLVIARD